MKRISLHRGQSGRLLLAGAALVLLSAASLHADRVILNNNRVWEGRILSENPDAVVIDTPGGPVKVPRTDIKHIERSKTKEQLYQERAADLNAKDLNGHYLLGLWCENQGLSAQAQYHLLYVLGLDADHEGAHKALGHVRHQGKWMTHAEAMQTRGLKLYKGRWMTPDQAEQAQAAEKREAQAAALAKAVRKIARQIESAPDFRDRLEAEKALYRMHDPLAFPAIADLLDSDSPQVRIAALKTIRKLNIQDVRGKLARTALFDPVEEVRLEPGALLPDRYNDRVRGILIQALQSEHKQVRSSAARILGAVKDTTTISALIEGLYLTYHCRNGEAAPVLGIVGTRNPDPRAMPRTVPLDQPLDSPDVFVINYDALEVLQNLTGQDFGTSKRAWLEWWTENEDEFTIWSRAKQEGAR